MDLRNHAIVAGISATLALGVVSPAASATPQSELAEAAERLDTLGGELSELQDELANRTTSLEKTSYRIGEKADQISETEEDLAEARKTLGGRMRSSYKSGRTSLLSLILGADSLSDIITRIYYFDKVAESDAQAIDDVKALEDRLGKEKADLEHAKAVQQKAIDELQGQIDEYGTKIAEAQEYYDSLDAQIQAELAAQQEAEENARIQAAMEAAEREREEQEQAAAREAAEEQAETPEPEEAEQDDAPEESEADTAEEEGEDPVEQDEQASDETSADEEPKEPKQPSHPQEAGGLSTAYAVMGSPYAYGAAGPSSFDCSGLVCYCYGYGRGRSTYDMISSLKADGSWKTSMADLSLGDLIFTHEGHVGIYVGNGEMIHAPSPGLSVCQAPVYAFIGGGTF